MYTLIGIDPGIVDTAIVSLYLDPIRKRWQITTQVWSNVTRREGQTRVVDSGFLEELKEFVEHESTIPEIFIEGFRNRGRDMRQDQDMVNLVQTINRTLKGSKIVDNTSIKKIVTEPLLKLFQMNRFPGTNHADIKSAARVALRGGIGDDFLNRILADFVRDNLTGEKWSLESMQTL